MQFRRRARPRVAIDIAPLVDVVFLLVIFFAVSTTFLESSGMNLELPESSATAAGGEPRDVTVLLAADGSILFDGEPVTREDLGRRLTSSLERREVKRVVLRADTASRHGDVVKVMDVIRASGAEGLTVAARAAAPGSD